MIWSPHPIVPTLMQTKKRGGNDGPATVPLLFTRSSFGKCQHLLYPSALVGWLLDGTLHFSSPFDTLSKQLYTLKRHQTWVWTPTLPPWAAGEVTQWATFAG